MWQFVLKNPGLSFGELWKDVNRAAFLRDAQKLVPSVTEDMVEPSFTGAQRKGRCRVPPPRSCAPRPLLTRTPPHPSLHPSGVMAQVFEADGTAAKDYIFERGCLGGTVLNVRNAPSPACTASLAIAEQVVDAAAEDFKGLAALR